MPFTKGDPNINRNGRPKKDQTLTDIAREYLDSKYKVPGTDKEITRKEVLVAKVFSLTMRGSESAARLIWNYIDGMPKQSMEIYNEKDAEWLEILKQQINEAKRKAEGNNSTRLHGNPQDNDS